MRYVFGLGGVFVLSLMLSLGCSEGGGEGGSGGEGGTGGMAGSGGSGGVVTGCYRVDCEDIDCDDGDPCTRGECNFAEGTCSYRAACDDFNDCTTEMCNPADGSCSTPSPVADGTPCGGGTCQSGVCELTGTVLPCTEQGIRNAIAAGVGPYRFDCSGPTTLSTQAEFLVENDVILDGQGNLTLDGNCGHRLFAVGEEATEATVELWGFILTKGLAEGHGGGVRNLGTLTLVDMTVSRCDVIDPADVGASGAAIANEGTLTLKNSIVSENGVGEAAIDNGFGAFTIANSTISGNGGGIFTSTLLMVNDSTVSDNVGSEANIAVDGEAGLLVLNNSTVSGNEAGIGISGASVTLVNSTVSASVVGIGNNGGTVTVTASVVDGICESDTDITSGGYNIESPSDTCGFDQTGDQPGVTAQQLNLGPLQDNGGPTMTHALLPGSVAIDQIPAEDCVDADGAPLTTDQRGEPRPVAILGPELKCDIGAFEVQP